MPDRVKFTISIGLLTIVSIAATLISTTWATSRYASEKNAELHNATQANEEQEKRLKAVELDVSSLKTSVDDINRGILEVRNDVRTAMGWPTVTKTSEHKPQPRQ